MEQKSRGVCKINLRATPNQITFKVSVDEFHAVYSMIEPQWGCFGKNGGM